MLKVIFWFKSRLDAHTFDTLSEQLSKDQNTVRSVCLAVALLIGVWAYANSDQQLFLTPLVTSVLHPCSLTLILSHPGNNWVRRRLSNMKYHGHLMKCLF